MLGFKTQSNLSKIHFFLLTKVKLEGKKAPGTYAAWLCISLA